VCVREKVRDKESGRCAEVGGKKNGNLPIYIIAACI